YTAAPPTKTVIQAGNGTAAQRDQVQVGDASHNLDGVHDLTVHGGTGTTLLLDDEANRDQTFLDEIPGFTIERQSRPVDQVTDGAVVRTNNRTDVEHDTTGKVVGSDPLDPLVATVGYSGLAGLTVQGGHSGNKFDVQSTAAGTPVTITGGTALPGDP